MAPAMNVKINGSIAALLQLVATVAFLAGTWPVEVKSGGISFKLDANAMDITFGAGGASGSDTAVVGFVFSIIASLLCFVGVIFGFKGKFKIAKGGFGFALIFNCLYYIGVRQPFTAGARLAARHTRTLPGPDPPTRKIVIAHTQRLESHVRSAR